MPMSRQSGFTLLEVLVALVVVTIGLLGVVSLYAAGIASTQQSTFATRATVFAQDIADRMRANPDGVAAGVFDAIDHPSDGGEAPANCRTQSCAADELAYFDAYRWDERLSESLPSGSGGLACNDAPCQPDSDYTVTIRWREKMSDGFADQAYETVITP